MDLDLIKNKILIIKDESKNSIVKLLSKSEKIINTKIITLNELIKKYYFDYDNRSIVYVSNKYKVIPSIARIYLDNLVYAKDINDKKVKLLLEIKNDLDNRNLLIRNKVFKDYLKNKDIILYELDAVDDFTKELLDEIGKSSNISSINESGKTTKKDLYEALNKEEEISFVASQICDLIKDNVDINNIKIANVKEDYVYTIKKVFSKYNIPINIYSNEPVNGSIIVNKFKELFSNDINSTIKLLEEYVKCNRDKILLNKIIDIVDSYYFCENYLDVKEFIFEEVEKIKIDREIYKDAVDIVEFETYVANEDEYVFLINYNLNSIPVIYKNEDFLSDDIKIKLGINPSYAKNKNNIELVRRKILLTKNLTVTYSKYDLQKELYISSSYDEKLFNHKNIEYDYTKSNDYNKMELVKNLDEYRKYGTKLPSLDKLYNHYNLKYMSYDNSFKMKDNETLNKYLQDRLVLSYTNLNDYNHCSFRYYLDYIIGINIFEDTFASMIGSAFHKVLSVCYDDNFDLDTEYENAIKNINYKAKPSEKYFINKLKSELKFIIDTIKEQDKYISLKKRELEKHVEIQITNNVIFKGFIDKVLYDDDTAIIIDYKTGNPSIDLNNLPYGIEIQLPIYVYLAKKAFNDIKIGGFYLQKILSSSTDIDKKQEDLKLQGYSNSDIGILEKVDSSYQNSHLIKSLRMTNNGFYSYAKVLSHEQINNLCVSVDNVIKVTASSILNANFDINPKEIDGELIGCKYCKYKDICYRKNEDIVKLEKQKYSDFLGGDVNAKLD